MLCPLDAPAAARVPYLRCVPWAIDTAVARKYYILRIVTLVCFFAYYHSYYVYYYDLKY